MAEFITTFGDVDIYNIQGLEKLNDLTTQEFFRATNRSKFLATYQLLCLRLRREWNRSVEELPLKKKRASRINAKSLIFESEKEKDWAQFKVNGQILFNFDINNICTPNSSVKVKLK